MMKDVYKAYSLGLKTLYYHNTRDGQNEAELANLGCESGACAIWLLTITTSPFNRD